MLPEYTREELAQGLDSMAEEILQRAGRVGPPVDAFAVANALGLAVAWDDRQQGRARYVRLGSGSKGRGRGAILLSPDPRAERRQWAIAHEIGEHVACEIFARWGTDPYEATPNARESVANALAGRLLLPTRWFSADGAACDWDLLALKSRYATASHELIARRMLECPPPVIITIFDHERITFRRSNLPGRAPPASDAELSGWRLVHSGNRPLDSRDAQQRLRGWPLHVEGWRREILRLELDACALEVL
jgi:hypothetical protein